MYLRIPFCCVLLGCLLPLTALALQDDPPVDDQETELSDAEKTLNEVMAGHSYHGEAFNEGPRQQAYLMGGTGNVSFPVTTKSKQVQAFINQGVGQLHGFWDLEAERTFRHAASLDPHCAMAYWGAALANYKTPKRARGFIKKAVEAINDETTDREQMYIKALESYLGDDSKGSDEGSDDSDEKKKRAAKYLRDLESIALKYPDDLEARAFIVHRVWANAREGINITSYLAADALLNEIFRKDPLHPAHHYAIHLWDYRKPEQAVKSAGRCGPAAPAIAHMWHMPGHIYSNLKRYEDAIYQQEASARVDHAHMMRDQVMPDEIHNFAHNNEWLIRNLIFVGRAHDALDLAKNMIELPQHPKYNTLEQRGGSADFGRRRLMQLLREFHMFDEAIELCQSSYLEAAEAPEEQVKTLRLLGSAAAIKGRDTLVQESRNELESIKSEAESKIAEKQANLDELGEQTDPDNKESKEETSERKTDPVEANTEDDEEGEGEKEGEIDASENKSDPAKAIKKEKDKLKKEVRKLKSLIRNADKAILAIEGYQAVAAKDYQQAIENLEEAKAEDLSWIAELKYLAGDKQEGLEQLEKQVSRRKSEVIPLARLAYLRYLDGDIAAALKSFEELRECSSSIAVDLPMFERLQPMAEELQFGSSWLKQYEVPADAGFRPELSSLGPFRWSPPKAPEWTLIGEDGSQVTHREFAGRPCLMIFYLGYGCLHCAEQLQAFGPRYDDFKEAGIDMIAISSDDESGLKISIKNYEGQMPIPLIADPQLKVFKKFKAYDDFEKQALHGTFLIDAAGNIRWQDISYEPFMDHEFLIKEAQRLLSQQVEPTTARKRN